MSRVNDVSKAETSEFHLAFVLQTLEDRDVPIYDKIMMLGHQAVEQQDLYVICSQPLQTAFNRTGQCFGVRVEIINAGSVSPFRDEIIRVPWHTLQRPSENLLAVLVSLVSVDQIDAHIKASAHEGRLIILLQSLVLSEHAGAACAQAQKRYVEFCFSQRPIMHYFFQSKSKIAAC